MSNYKRLTKKDEEYGNYVQNELSALNEPSIAVSCYGKIHGTVINRLAELEDKIENGTLIELPCKVGDTVYHIDCYPHIVEDIVDEIWINDYNEVCYDFRKGCRYLVSEFCVKWFLTKAEAEAKLRELEFKKRVDCGNASTVED